MSGILISLGDVIGGRYQLEAVLGHGGMAIVYKARHTGTGKANALKIVHPNLASRPELVDMFVREARVAGRMGDHPNVVNVFDAGVDEPRRVPFMVMELLDGQTLEEHLQAQTPMAWPLVRTLLEQLTDALEHAHRAGVVHRDLKPGNLFLTKDHKGQPVLKVMDFGIAKVLEQSVEGSVTRIGSPLYAAPEQQAGDTFRGLAHKQGSAIAREVSPATDVWAIGLIAYEMLTGLPKMQIWGTVGTLDDLMVKVVLEATPVPSARAGERASLLPGGFDAWFARCLMKNAAHRWQSAKEAAGALLQLLDSTEVRRNKTTQRMVVTPDWPPPPPTTHSEPLTGQMQGSTAPRTSQPSFHDDITAQGGTVRIPPSAVRRPSQPSLTNEGSARPSAVDPAKQTIPQMPTAAAMVPASFTPVPGHRETAIGPPAATSYEQPRPPMPSVNSEIRDPALIASSTGTPVARTLGGPRQGYPRRLFFGAIGAGAALVLLVVVLVGRRWTSEIAAPSPSTVPDTAPAPAASPSGQNEPQGGAALPDGPPAAQDGATTDTNNEPTDSPSAAPTSTGSPEKPQLGAFPPPKENPAAKQGSVYIVSKGTGGECTVIINGKRLGQTPLAKRVDAGKMSVRCVLAAGETQVKTIEVQPGKHTDVSFKW
jgi:serine/threonine protein kinase